MPHELVVDSAAAGLIRRGEVDAVIVGCDRVAANGDVANKVGTYGLALAARAAGHPVRRRRARRRRSTPRWPTATASRSRSAAADEVRRARRRAVAPPGTPVRNPAFDVTPAELVTALVTERGVAAPPTAASVAALLGAA